VISNGVGDPFTTTGEASGSDYVLAVSTLEPRRISAVSWRVSGGPTSTTTSFVSSVRGWGRRRVRTEP
jgi:hypothetical protein